MNIYIENIIFLNAIIYISFMLIITYAFHFKLNIIKSIIASLIVSALSFIFSFLDCNFLTFILKIDSIIFLLSFSYKNFTYKKLVQSFVLFTLISNIFNGLLTKTFLSTNHGILINTTIPIYLFLVILFIFTLLLRKCFDIIILKSKACSHICKIELCFNNKKIHTTGYLDTGNNLTHNNNPVSIINFNLFNKLTNISLSDFFP